MTTNNFYDDKGRVIQSISQNHLGGMDIVSSEYDFVGKVKQSNHYHTAGSIAVTSIQNLLYDHAGRQKQETLQLTGSNTLPSTIVSKLVYNELGQLVTKKLAAEVKKADYRYNIRGWLTRINDPTDLTNGDLFGMQLSYDIPFGDYISTAQYNGNISSMKWQTASIGGQKGYTFTYDSINRLRDAIFGEYSGAWTSSDKYSEKNIGYDLNGNISCLQRRGWLASNQWGVMDNLSYYYKGNQLIGVNDANTVPNNGDFIDNGFTDIPSSTNTNTWEYTYDGNGNFTRDINKGIVNVQYNALNLPRLIDFGNNNRIEYSYNMSGTKMKKLVYNSGVNTGTTDYVNGFVYENNSPSYMLFDEGRILLANGTGTPEYHLKDHLGNVRVAFGADGTVKQVNSYYPFGMNIYGLTSTETTSTKNKYLYNGKEYQGDFNVNLLDYGARFYDEVIGRFTTIDPLAAKARRISPYAYCYDDPIRFIDPDGMEGIVISGQPGDHKNRKHFLTDGLDRAKSMAKQFKKEGKGEKATWLIYNEGGKGGYSAKDLASTQKEAAKAGINVQVVSDTKTITDYVNEKTVGDSRANDQITNFSYLGHATPGDLDIGFVDHGLWNMATNTTLDVSDLKSSAFAKDAKVDLVGGCRTAVPGFFSKSVIDQFAKILSPAAIIKGSSTRVNYADGEVDTDQQLVEREGGKIITIHGKKEDK